MADETGADNVEQEAELRAFNSGEMGAIAHLYRAEVYRSTLWRTRLDTTTNWSVVTLGVALSISFSSPEASPLPLLLVGVLIMLFLALEARRYRYFNVWRARTRWLEKNFYEPLLLGQADKSMEWRKVLADDYHSPRYHVGYLTSMARRIRRNYLWILLIQALAFCGKLMVHPGPVASWAEFADRADIGPLPGEVILAIGALYCATWAGLAVWVVRADARRHLKRTGPADAMG